MSAVQGIQIHAVELATAVRASVAPEALVKIMKYVMLALVSVMVNRHVKLPQTRATEPIASAGQIRNVREITKTYVLMACVRAEPGRAPVQVIAIIAMAVMGIQAHLAFVVDIRGKRLALSNLIHATKQNPIAVVDRGEFHVLDKM